MEEKMILISSSKMEALVGLLGSCSELWESNADPGNLHQRLGITNLHQGIEAVKGFLENNQSGEGGEGQ